MQICGKQALIEGKLVRVARLDAEGFDFFDDPESALEIIRKAREGADLFTFTQKLSDTSPKYSYPTEWDNLAALRVTSFDDWMTKQIDFKARNKARKAAKNGVVVKEVPFDDELIRGISGIYNESPIRQGRRFWHYRKDLDTLRRMKATFSDRSIFIGAFFEGSMIGFIKLVPSEDRSQAGLMHIASMFLHRDKAPTNALIAQAVRSCADRKIPYLWYANFSYRKKQQDSLADFKRHNGFQKVDVPRYYVPLTLRGRIAYQLGLHHEIADSIPEPLAATFRKIRRFWYTRKFPGFENA